MEIIAKLRPKCRQGQAMDVQKYFLLTIFLIPGIFGATAKGVPGVNATANIAEISANINAKPINGENPVAAIDSLPEVSTATSVAVAPGTLITTTRRPLQQGIRLPCRCTSHECGCCSGMLLDRFRQKACMNLTYDPDEFSVTASMSMNERILYKNTFSGKHPDPMCIRVPRFRFIEFCVEFSNIYLVQRNLHMCVDAEASWEDFTLIEWSFDCMRLGANGFAVIGPADGAGIALQNLDEDDEIEDYDENVRSATAQDREQFKEPNKNTVTMEILPNGWAQIRFQKQ